MKDPIPPEIIHDEFAHWLERIIFEYPVKSILELGASSGEGSTACFVRGMALNPQARLWSLEASKERFSLLQERYRNNPRVTCINAFSVPKSEWLTYSDIDLLTPEFGCEFGSATIKQWLQKEIDYLAESGVAEYGIAQATRLNGGSFDVVLIDSSLFTGVAELRAVRGARFIALDDVRSMKNGQNLKVLKADPKYTLLASGPNRYGWAIFKAYDD